MCAAPRITDMKIVFFANTDWYLFNFRLDYARYLRERGHEVVMVAPPGQFAPRLQQEGFRWVPMPMHRRSLNPLREAAVIARLMALYRAERPDLAHHFTIKCVVYGSLAARFAGVRAVVNAVAGFGSLFVSDRPTARLLRPAVRRLLKMASDQRGSCLVVQNMDDLGVFQSMRLSANANLKLIRGSGVNVARFKPGAAPRPPGPPRILFVGRLLYDKGIAEFVECARRCRSARPGAMEFLAAGEADSGNPASVTRTTLDEWKSRGDVQFIGQVTDMPALLASVDIVVLPSYNEGAPRSLIEAAACEKPLIASDVGGCREVVIDGVNGLLVPVRDVAKLTAAVLKLAGDPQLRALMGQAGRQHVLKELDEQIVFRETYRTYEYLAAVPSAAPRGGEAQA